MGKPAARVGDFHMCPMVTPGVPPIPHVGGPILPPGVPTVLIGGMPAATLGNMCTCTGPPDSIILGSMGVLIGGKPAARMGDSCAHGGAIMLGCMTVLIGEMMPGGGGGGGGGAVMAGAYVSKEASSTIVKATPVEFKTRTMQIISMKNAAVDGTPLVHNSTNCADCASKK